MFKRKIKIPMPRKQFEELCLIKHGAKESVYGPKITDEITLEDAIANIYFIPRPMVDVEIDVTIREFFSIPVTLVGNALCSMGKWIKGDSPPKNFQTK